MKLTPCNLLPSLLVLFTALAAHARTVTLVVNNGPVNGMIVYTSSVNIGTNETATVSGLASTGRGQVFAQIVKDGVTNNVMRVSAPTTSFKVAGSALIILDTDSH